MMVYPVFVLTDAIPLIIDSGGLIQYSIIVLFAVNGILGNSFSWFPLYNYGTFPMLFQSFYLYSARLRLLFFSVSLTTSSTVLIDDDDGSHLYIGSVVEICLLSTKVLMINA